MQELCRWKRIQAPALGKLGVFFAQPFVAVGKHPFGKLPLIALSDRELRSKLR